MTATRKAKPTRLGRLFRRASTWQKVVVVVCAVIAAHGTWVMFVPPVQLEGTELTCPPAVVAAVAGSGGVDTPEASPELAEQHDAACAATGRQWLLATVLQVGLATVWGVATLEWGRVWRRARRRGRSRG